MNVEKYIAGVTLHSDQVSKREVAIILNELQRLTPAGDVVEFGCYEGTTSIHIAKLLKDSDRHLYLYDSFEGLPDKRGEDKSPAGEQFKTGELLASKKVLINHFKHAGLPLPIIKKSWFSDLKDHDVPHTIAFAFLDGDYYESICTPLRLIQSYLVPGATVIVDDYANEALPGAAKAVDEWVRSRNDVTMRVEASLAIIHLQH